MYIDIGYYKANGGERDMTGAAFGRYAFRAQKIVDRCTQGRVKSMAKVPEAVKRLMVELITLESVQGKELADVQAVRSFTNDGYSETLTDPITGERAEQIKCDLMLEYLSGEVDDAGTPLLYLGVE